MQEQTKEVDKMKEIREKRENKERYSCRINFLEDEESVCAYGDLLQSRARVEHCELLESCGLLESFSEQEYFGALEQIEILEEGRCFAYE